MNETLIPAPDFSATRKIPKRYVGDELGLSLGHFDPAAVEAIRKLYTTSQALLDFCADIRLSGEVASLARSLSSIDWENCLKIVRAQLQVSDSGQPNLEQMRKICHDIRGGAFSNAALLIDLIQVLGERASLWHIERLFFLVRDHLKIMRNCFTDLDEDKRGADLEYNYHSTALLREKWDGFKIGETRVSYHSEEDVNIASCCMEFSTLDRIIYNLVNNAIRHADDTAAELHAHRRTAADGSEHMLIYTQNRVTSEQSNILSSKFGSELGKLFEGGFTTTGSGLGMRICTECVCSAYGIGNIKNTIQRHYVGARLQDSCFYAWVHWPLIAD